MKNHHLFKGQRLPSKCDPRAWRLAVDHNFEFDGESVILTVTTHLIHSKVGPAMRLELHPLKREQSSRLFRQFGSDRFLEVRVPTADSWQSGEKDIEAIAARWLTRKPHVFMERQWSGFYVRDRPLKVETQEGHHDSESRPVFYDRVLLFAEEGKGLRLPSSCIDNMADRTTQIACSRHDMLDWLLNLEKNDSQSYLKLFHRVALGTTPTPLLVHPLCVTIVVID